MTATPASPQSKIIPLPSNVYVTVQPTPAPSLSPQSPYQDYGFWINVALSVATLGVTVVAVVVGVAAFLGYSGIRNVARKESAKHAQGAVNEYLKSQMFKNQIREAAKKVVQDKIKDKILVVPTDGVVTTPVSSGKIELS